MKQPQCSMAALLPARVSVLIAFECRSQHFLIPLLGDSCA